MRRCEENSEEPKFDVNEIKLLINEYSCNRLRRNDWRIRCKGSD